MYFPDLVDFDIVDYCICSW